MEPFFQSLALDLLVPATGAFPPAPGKDASALREWYDGLRHLATRDTAFLDEKLAYAVTIHIPSPSEDDSPPPDVVSLARQLQLTATASFLPPGGPGAESPVDKRRSMLPGLGHPGASFSGPSQAALTPSTSRKPEDATAGAGAGPLTPVPMPASTPTAQQFANMAGVVVWEGVVETPDGARPSLVKVDGGWVAVWRGEMPVVYVRTSIQNPVLALTVSATLRESGTRRKNAPPAGDGVSLYSTTTMHTEGAEDDDETVDLAEMEEIDLLGGLADEPMPASRLGPSLRDDLSIRVPPTPAPYTPGTPHMIGTPRTPLTTSTTLRKSFRRVLGLSPGLRVRMRTMFLPQLIPPTDDGEGDSDDAGERRIVLCIEIENGAEAGKHAFEIEGVSVEVGGKGAKVTASLLCQPGQEARPPQPVFPLRLQHLEQYNLLYAVEVVSTGGVRGDEHRPVSIVLNARPFATRSETSDTFVTSTFQSRWNCALDLAPFYASLPPAPPAPHSHAPQSRQVAHRLSKPTPPTPNAIAGDKRYSLATLLAEKPDRRVVTNPPRPALPSASRVVSTRGPNPTPAIGDGHGLLVSVKVLTPEQGIAPLDTFFIEVFVHNRTDSVKRFRLAVPPRDAFETRVKDAWARRRRRDPSEPSYGADDAVLAALLTQHEASSPALLALETDVRCGPLLPGASLSARIRFLALRDGVHSVERLRITGVGEDFDFVISPVLEVVVGVVE